MTQNTVNDMNAQQKKSHHYMINREDIVRRMQREQADSFSEMFR